MVASAKLGQALHRCGGARRCRRRMQLGALPVRAHGWWLRPGLGFQVGARRITQLNKARPSRRESPLSRSCSASRNVIDCHCHAEVSRMALISLRRHRSGLCASRSLSRSSPMSAHCRSRCRRKDRLMGPELGWCSPDRSNEAPPEPWFGPGGGAHGGGPERRGFARSAPIGARLPGWRGIAPARHAEGAPPRRRAGAVPSATGRIDRSAR